ncbi:DNA primase large subunit PriL [Thermococcus gorgonarius]|uniref:DNA primase large subunit PriL n=1 Tax=Thermococcus gorgonarius TaxID=71997 RepID=A0A2Z2MFV7_THEGO|nr:DNA primase large subunit PriL [Thermococcus gorgonarius]ASJ01341.1 DNA primase [Thermococcus gorgonarius]
MLDPFGQEARKIIQDFGGIEEFLEKIPRYVEISDVMSRVTWEGNIPNELVSMEGWKDLMEFYALLGALAHSPYGFEMELVKEKNMAIYLKRIEGSQSLEKLSLPIRIVREGEVPEKDRLILEKLRHREIAEEERRKLRIEYKIWLRHFLPLWNGSLKDLYIRNSWVYLKRSDVIDLWKKHFERNLERAVNLLYEIRDDLPEFYTEVYEKLRELAQERFKERIEKMGSVGAQPLRFDLFPPCIKKALSGVGSGMRNYAITVLLTSFLSYARICPNPPRRDIRIKDCVKDMGVIEKEILPIIIEAGNRCKPPLFEDQPNEVKNIWYHLGFGYTDSPSLEDSGNSTWYFPPNCDKIRANAPELCKPDRYCRGIKNPLTYYLRRLYYERKKGEGEEGERAL